MSSDLAAVSRPADGALRGAHAAHRAKTEVSGSFEVPVSPGSNPKTPAPTPAPLPSLPVPDVGSALAQLRETYKALYEDDEAAYAEVVSLLDDFEGTMAKDLHEQLRARPLTADNRHYFDMWWRESYLRDRSPLPLNVNPFFVLEDDATPNRNSQVARATSLLVSALAFYAMIRTGTLAPDEWRGEPLCMAQYQHLFGSARIPGRGCDTFHVHERPTHVVVMARGRVYWFHVLNAAASTILPHDRIARILELILQDAESCEPEESAAAAVGLLTSLPRDRWADARSRLESCSAANKRSLELIESALLVLCLDAECPSSLTAASANFLVGSSSVDETTGLQVGSCANRWWDKTLSLIVCANGVAGVNFEHSHVDGHTVLRFSGDIITDSILRFARSIRSTLPPSLTELRCGDIGLDGTPHRVVWHVEAPLLRVLHWAEGHMSDLVHQADVVALEFHTFGKQALKDARMSPDAFVQLAIQLAYYLLYGELVNTYETVMTKRFDSGRTEPVRTLAAETRRFVQTFCDARASSVDRLQAMRAALKAHSRRTVRSASGAGAERLMFAMERLSREREAAEAKAKATIEETKSADGGGTAAAAAAARVHPFFDSPAWRALNANVISTSNCGNPSLRLFGFGPVVLHGLGIGYLVKDHGMNFCICSRQRQTGRFAALLDASLTEMLGVVRDVEGVQARVRAEDTLGSVPLGGSTPVDTHGGGSDVALGDAAPGVGMGAGDGGAGIPLRRRRSSSFLGGGVPLGGSSVSSSGSGPQLRLRGLPGVGVWFKEAAR